MKRLLLAICFKTVFAFILLYLELSASKIWGWLSIGAQNSWLSLSDFPSHLFVGIWMPSQLQDGLLSKDWLKFLIKVIPVSVLHRARNWRVISKVYYGQFCSNIVFWWGECQGKKTVRVLLWQGKGLKPLFTLIAEIHACSCREPFSAWSCLTQLIENRVFCGWLLPGIL